ncbi:MAG: glycosyltransferase [Solirubrobacteraceae bacterium]
MRKAHLHVQLEAELPAELSIGAGTALFVCGWCFSPETRIEELTFVLDGESRPVSAQGMPRLDPFRALHPGLDPFASPSRSEDADSEQDPLLHSYSSGFWGIVRVAPRGPGWLELKLRAVLADGTETEASLAEVAIVQAPAPARMTERWSNGAGEPRVAICLATYNPPADLLERQLDSIRAQSHRNWICIVSDDCSSPGAYARLETAIGSDPRFLLTRSKRRLGFYGNFERALSLVPGDTQYVAMSDQDDFWHPDKLETLLAAIGDAQLVYSDARVVTREGEEISATWWNTRRNNHDDLLSLLVANAVTGAASLVRREVLDLALPFPPHQFAHFHDHWLGLTALATGRIAYVDRPLYDYVQHGNASLGHAAANRMTSLRDRLVNQRAPRARIRMWRLHYFADVCRLQQFATVLELRCGERLSRRKRRALDCLMRGDRSAWPLLRLGWRGVRELTGPPETLGAEWMLFHAFLWRRLLAASASPLPRRRLRLDALPPASLIAGPGHSGLDASVAAVAEKIAPLRWAVDEQAPPRVNLLLPTIDLQHLFGGYIAKFNLARKLVEAGLRVRLVTVDPVGPLPPGWRATLEDYRGLEGLFAQAEVVFGREASSIEISPADSFVATTWWTAHIAHDVQRFVEGERFLYLVQEYEPFTFPMGTFAALAAESYTFEHFALFSSELLRDYFRRHRIGVFAQGEAEGDRRSVSFQNAITPVVPPPRAQLVNRAPRKLLFYARPEPHAARNMFELGVLALSRAIDEGLFSDGWELRGIGTVDRGRLLSLGGGAALELLPRCDQSSYGDLLGEHDIGLALMYTPHPSLVPIEMASAGLLAVTNSFENKTPEAMQAISGNLIVAEPTVDGVLAGLRAAVERVADVDGRLAECQVRWSRSWEQSLGPGLVHTIVGALMARSPGDEGHPLVSVSGASPAPDRAVRSHPRRA